MILLFAIFAITSAQIRPLAISTRDRDAIILKQNYDLNPDGSYVYGLVDLHQKKKAQIL